eukprot:5803487-Amphidinium_carterae.1
MLPDSIAQSLPRARAMIACMNTCSYIERLRRTRLCLNRSRCLLWLCPCCRNCEMNPSSAIQPRCTPTTHTTATMEHRWRTLAWSSSWSWQSS